MMMKNAFTDQLQKVHSETVKAQHAAADPVASVWVNANAGTGKTHILTRRVLRILLSGTPPERILCLTYTKAAAAEMSKRLFDELAEWVIDAPEDLQKKLAAILDCKPNATETELARTLFTSAIETPGGLKIQTIHAFAKRLLQRFPLEAGVPAGFRILDEDNGRELKTDAIESTLAAATSGNEPKLENALNTIVRHATDMSFDRLLENAISRRDWIDELDRLRRDDSTDALSHAKKFLHNVFNLPDNVTENALETARAQVLQDDILDDLRQHLESGSKTDKIRAEELQHARKSLSSRALQLESFFLTGQKKKRASLMTAALKKERPDLAAQAESAQQRFAELSQQLKVLSLVDATLALYRLASEVLQRYEHAKQISTALDFDDLIRKARSLLIERQSAQWVLYKLDRGLDHILVDEAQDTSPDQWQVIRALAEEFFTGNSAREEMRTIFAVGDEKQSIYSFQGAAPEMFAAMAEKFDELARPSGTALRRIPLDLSFRTIQPILDGVDYVFADRQKTPGLTASEKPIQHFAHRYGQAGLIEIWPAIAPVETPDVGAWEPLSDRSERAPANILAENIAELILRWIKSDELLKSQNRPITPGDILILVRKRNPFASPMVTALKRRGIPVAGSDRIILTNQLAIQDLLVLGDFLTLPEDDLALATILKSPMFELTDDGLLTIAPRRKGALWKAVLEAARAGQEQYIPAAETLRRWRAKADFTPPFEFYSALLDRDGMRQKILNRMGPEAADSIDEFLDQALSYDDSNPPSLTGFLAHIRATDREIKRDMDHDRNEVRVMTVHGAKGLEAPIVFLPDTCSTASGNIGGNQLIDIKFEGGFKANSQPFVWSISGSRDIEAINAAHSVENAKADEERNRLLYVAMTRARDRLYIAGFNNSDEPPDDCWHTTIKSALLPHAAEVRLPDGSTGWRIETQQESEPETTRNYQSPDLSDMTLPSFASRHAPVEPQISIPLAPSRLEPYAPDDEGEPLMSSKPDAARVDDLPSPRQSTDGIRFLRGEITHALLQHLPEVQTAKRKEVAHAFVERRASILNETARRRIVTEVMQILSDPTFAPLFGPDSRAEVAISAMLSAPGNEKGPLLNLTGQIDRLAIVKDTVLIVDYKTNRPPPEHVENVARAYLYQLAAYVLAIREIYPNHNVRAALLWTFGPQLMEIPHDWIEKAITELWELDTASLDAA